MEDIENVYCAEVKKFEGEVKVCRICYDIDTPENHVIVPCKCSGSMKYIHEKCLEIWLLTNSENLQNSECDICKFKLIIKVKVRNVIHWRSVLRYRWFLIRNIFYLIALCSGCIIASLCILDKLNTIKPEFSEKLYLGTFIITVLIIFFTVVIKVKRFFRENCSCQRVLFLKIESLEEEDINQTRVSEIFLKEMEKKVAPMNEISDVWNDLSPARINLVSEEVKSN